MGKSDTNLINNFPGLTQADLNEAWAYYQNNLQEIENTILEQGKE